jgi:hypothetical protein
MLPQHQLPTRASGASECHSEHCTRCFPWGTVPEGPAQPEPPRTVPHSNENMTSVFAMYTTPLRTTKAIIQCRDPVDDRIVGTFYRKNHTRQKLKNNTQAGGWSAARSLATHRCQDVRRIWPAVGACEQRVAQSQGARRVAESVHQ